MIACRVADELSHRVSFSGLGLAGWNHDRGVGCDADAARLLGGNTLYSTSEENPGMELGLQIQCKRLKQVWAVVILAIAPPGSSLDSTAVDFQAKMVEPMLAW